MRTNNRLLNNFLQDIISNGLSKNTASSYESDLIQFINYINEKYHNNSIIIDNANNTFFQSITLEQMNEYKSKLFTEGKASNTRSRAITAIKQLWKYLSDINVITENPAEKLVKPDIPKRERVYLSLEDSMKLLDSVGNIDGEYKERDFAILTLFLNCGFRLAELVSIDINKIKNDMITVIGKGNKERTVPINDACIEAIEDYLKVRLNIEGENALFLSERKKRISKRTVQHLVKKYLNISVEESEKLSVHKLRHTAATLMYKYGKIDIRTLQQILGHENIHTTEIYTHVDDEQKKSAIDSNPLNNYKKVQ
jgi:site-specific recombinase XerD